MSNVKSQMSNVKSQMPNVKCHDKYKRVVRLVLALTYLSCAKEEKEKLRNSLYKQNRANRRQEDAC